MKSLFIVFVIVAMCFGRTRTAGTIGTSNILSSPDVGKIQYETVVKHNLVCADIDSILVDIGGVSADSVSKTALSATRLYVSDSASVDTLVVPNLLSVSDSGYVDTLTVGVLYNGGAVSIDSVDENAGSDSLIIKTSDGNYFAIPAR